MSDYPAPSREVRTHWNEKAMDWLDWADPMSRISDHFNIPLIDAATINEGDTVLDIACGPGEPAFSAAKRCSPGGTVIATDISERMVFGLNARKRGESIVPIVSDMMALPFADDIFDAAICRFGIMFVDRTDLALSEIRRVLKPGAGCALTVWGKREEQTLFSVLSQAVVAETGIDLDHHHFAIFRFGDPAPLVRSLDNSGFSGVRAQKMEFNAEIPDGKPFWTAQLRMTFGHLLDKNDEALNERLNGRIEESFRHHMNAEGKIGIHSSIHIVSATA